MKLKNAIIWSLIGLALVFFWFSIRSQEDQFFYALIALGIWGLTYLIHRFWKDEEA